MSNTKYQRSANRERQLKDQFEKEGWLSIRSAGSHTKVDIIAIRPAASVCADPDHFEVKLIQVKTGKRIKKKEVVMKAEESPCGIVNIAYYMFPVNRRIK